MSIERLENLLRKEVRARWEKAGKRGEEVDVAIALAAELSVRATTAEQQVVDLKELITSQDLALKTAVEAGLVTVSPKLTGGV